MIFDKVSEVIKEEFDVENVNMDTVIREDLGADSIGLVELVMALEDEFDIEIDDSKLDEIITVSDIVSYIESSKRG
ncbi:acyl carrier protein [Lagierella massiliensis]|uniref:acyl carrier protein n=1 Tax=Lagierella massiliensis TaxID=1689303 RepID=UPI0006D8488F|nr:acyl carrier protein [Lagierella massiliensis]